MKLEEEIDALYAAAPSEFIAARKALAVRAKKAGDPEGAARVAGLAKPSAAAWAVNQIHRSAREELAGLLAIGVKLREAHRKGAAGVRDVFAAQQAQRAAIEGLTRTARSLMENAGLVASEATLAKVAETLTFISTLNRWGDAAPGQLVRELSPPGFDALLEVLGPESESAPPPEPPKPAAPLKPAVPAKEARESLDARRKALADARRVAEAKVAEASREQGDAEARAREAVRAADEMEQAAKAAETKARRLAEAAREAENALARARR